jgi:hypothetical protein
MVTMTDMRCTTLVNGDFDRASRYDAERGWRWVIALINHDDAAEQAQQGIGDALIASARSPATSPAPAAASSSARPARSPGWRSPSICSTKFCRRRTSSTPLQTRRTVTEVT